MTRRTTSEQILADSTLMPREKLSAFGLEALSLPELLAIIINTGYAGVSVLELAGRLLRDYGSLGLRDLRDLEALQEVSGLPYVKACQLLACLEIGRRIFAPPAKGEISRIQSPQDVYRLTEDMWKLEQEQLRGFYLNTRNRIVAIRVLTLGTAHANLSDPATVFKPALLADAAGVIIAHNHPSGECEASDADIAVTKMLAQAGKLLQIKLLDHLIVTAHGYLSLQEAGVLTT